MKKIKINRKEIKKQNYILGVGYCEMQYLLKCQEPFSYCCSVYGWGCDNYIININNIDLIISTGYNYIDSKNIKSVSYDTIQKYEKKASKINSLNYKNYNNYKKAVNNVLIEFLKKEVLK